MNSQHPVVSADLIPRLPPLMQLVKIALGLIVMSAASSLLNQVSSDQGGVSVIWLANGLLIGVLLCAPRKQWPVYLCVGFLIDFVVNLVLKTPPGYSVYLAVCNMVEVYVAAVLMFPAISAQPDLTQRRQILSFLFYGVCFAPLLASLLAVFGLRNSLHSSYAHAIQDWFAADMLGVATITPLYLSNFHGRQFSARSLPETVALILLLAAVSAFVFGLAPVPLMWLVLLSLILLGARVGFTGSALGLLIVIFIGGYFTVVGRGPLQAPLHASISIRILLFQIFILFSMLALYLTEVSMAESRRMRQGLETSETRFRLLAEASRDVIVLAGLDGKRKYVSPAATEILGWSQKELIGGQCVEMVHPDDLSSFADLLRSCREGRETGSLSYRCRRKDGTYVWLEANIRLYRRPVAEEPGGFVYILRDISERKRAENQLQEAFDTVERLAMVDGLTRVANRRLLDETLNREWMRASRDGTEISMLLIDVDYFKLFNDLYGHVAGDECLLAVASAIQNALRRPTDLLARYGGEEFVVVLPNTPGAGAELMAANVMMAVERCAIPHRGSPHRFVTVSLGCATMVAALDSSPTELIKAADAAMYQAKSQGRNRICCSNGKLVVK